MKIAPNTLFVVCLSSGNRINTNFFDSVVDDGVGKKSKSAKLKTIGNTNE